MSRVRTLFALVLPSALAGGLLGASAFSRADSGSGSAREFWPAASDEAPRTGRVLIAQAEASPPPRHAPPPPVPPVPPGSLAPPAPPVPPGPPSHRGHGRNHGVSVSIHGGKVEIDGIAELVQESLEKALETLDHLPDVPPDTRMRLRGRIQGMRNQLSARLGRLRSMDLDRIGPELERMGDEIERQMEGLDEELARLGDRIGNGLAKKFGKDFARSFGPGTSGVSPGRGDDADDDDKDDDDDDDRTAVTAPPPAGPGPDTADPDVGPAIAALKGRLSLDGGQRAELARLRTDSERQIEAAQRELARMSSRLHDTLRDAEAKESDVVQQIEAISLKEAAIRKARILIWFKVRHMLHADQRKQVEEALQNR